jgi:tetratricopeptide (TPR) repeat protein
MVRHLIWLLSALSALLLVGCAGVGVIATSDPEKKLSDASYLFDREDRPLIAERLIREAIEICKTKSDQRCLGEAYLTYGFFFRSPTIEGKWSKNYRENGFMEKSATFENRYEKSIEYFQKARQIFIQLERYDMLGNVNFNMGVSYEMAGEKKLACQAYDDSSKSNRDNLRQNPNAIPARPKGFSTFEDFLQSQRRRVGCT